MLIQVNYTDNRFDYVKDTRLQQLIESREIAGFRRSSGWVTVGVAPLRQFQRSIVPQPAPAVKGIIRVAYDEDHYDYVPKEMLDTLLEANKVRGFQRITGWVTVGIDPLRKSKRLHTFRNPNDAR